MALQKQPITLNFSQGIDQKTDPFQIPLGKFYTLQNSIFDKGGQLKKRNGYGYLPSLPDSASSYLTTFNGDLTAIGNSFYAYSSPSETWVEQADIQPVSISATSLIKSNTNQSSADSATAPNGFVCVAYTDQTNTSLSTPVHKYVIADSTTGQNIIAPTVLANASATYGTPRVFVLSNYFVVVYISASSHLEFVAITVSDPTKASSPATLSTSVGPSAYGLAFDGVVYNNTVYFVWNGASTSGVKMCSLTSHLSVSNTINPDASHIADILSIAVDPSDGTIWVSYYGYAANTAYALARSPQLNAILVATQIIPSPSTHVSNITSIAAGGILTFLYEITNAYTYDSGVITNYIKINTITESGTLGTATVLLRSVGLASKVFLVNGINYVTCAYQSPYQSSYFISDLSGNVISRLAYQNGGGYLYGTSLPSVTVIGTTAQFPYLIKDLIQAVNKNTNVSAGNQVAGIYSQTGINLANVTFGTDNLVSAEIGSNLHLNGGFVYGYDGYSVTENNFFLYPDSVKATFVNSGGSMTAQQYYYQVTYEWSDNQGNVFRSAPSIPVTITTGASATATVNVPTIRLSLKNSNNPVKIVVYRWSAAQQVYYQTSSISVPTINDPTVDFIAFSDTNADSTILGNNILYTTGGVIENIGPPAFDSVFLFDSRMWGIVSEDKNLLWFSKQVIESTPVEMSDLLTLYVSPTIGAQGSTGVLTCGSAMDDKMILFKKSAISYVTGEGPDNTGSNNGYSQPTFITSTVGCSNQRSIVFQPQGLMFEFASESGNQIWLLARNLQTEYIGAPVEAYTQNATVQSAINVPGTNQVRFTMSSGITLMYDYYFGQWGTFANIPAVSSVLYQGLHTYINSLGQAFQETPSLYLDGSNPVLMSFTTSWLNMAGLQGYQRAYFFYLLGVYLSPHKLNMQIAYDYNSAVAQQTIIQPDNFSPNYGDGYTYGVQPVYGGGTALEQWKINLTQQRCQSFQITLSELYDPSYGVAAGAGFTLSGLNIIVGLKKGYSPSKFTHQAGS